MDFRSLLTKLIRDAERAVEIDEIFLGGPGDEPLPPEARFEQEKSLIASRSRLATLQTLLEVLPQVLPVLALPAPTTVGQAVDQILALGPHRYGDIKRRIADEHPDLSVRDLDKSVTAALMYGLRTGKYRRLERGVYALADSKEEGAR